MSKVTATIDIAASPQEVWDKIMDPQHLDDWVTIHRKLRDYSEAPLKDGSTLEQTLCLRGVNFNVKWEVVEFDPPHLAVMEGRGPMRSKARITDKLSETEDGGTHFEYSNEFQAPGGPMGNAASRVLVGGVPQKEATASLKQLKSLLER